MDTILKSMRPLSPILNRISLVTKSPSVISNITKLLELFTIIRAKYKAEVDYSATLKFMLTTCHEIKTICDRITLDLNIEYNSPTLDRSSQEATVLLAAFIDLLPEINNFSMLTSTVEMKYNKGVYNTNPSGWGIPKDQKRPNKQSITQRGITGYLKPYFKKIRTKLRAFPTETKVLEELVANLSTQCDKLIDDIKNRALIKRSQRHVNMAETYFSILDLMVTQILNVIGSIQELKQVNLVTAKKNLKALKDVVLLAKTGVETYLNNVRDEESKTKKRSLVDSEERQSKKRKKAFLNPSTGVVVVAPTATTTTDVLPPMYQWEQVVFGENTTSTQTTRTTLTEPHLLEHTENGPMPVVQPQSSLEYVKNDSAPVVQPQSSLEYIENDEDFFTQYFNLQRQFAGMVF